WLKGQQTVATPVSGRSSTGVASATLPARKPSSLQRDVAGDPAELFIILPPNLDQAVGRGKVMLVFEAKWSGGRCPLNALPKGRSYAFSLTDVAVLERIEAIAQGETPALLQMETQDFASLLPLLAEHPRITLGKSNEIKVT